MNIKFNSIAGHICSDHHCLQGKLLNQEDSYHYWAEKKRNADFSSNNIIVVLSRCIREELQKYESRTINL